MNIDIKAIGTVVGVAGAGVLLLTNVFGLLDKLISLLGRMRHALHGDTDNKPRIPKKTLIAIPDPRVNALYWGYATIAGNPGMQVVGDFTITNVSAVDLVLTLAALRYSRGLRRHVQKASAGMHLSFRGFDGPLPPGKTAGVRAAFMYVDRYRPEKPGDLKADVALVDQFDNYHWVKGLIFKHPEKMF